MADQPKKISKSENSELQGKKIPQIEAVPHLERAAERVEKREGLAEQERIVSEQLRREIELMQLDEEAEKSAEKEKEKIEFLGEQGKIEHLLQLARQKGLVYAIQVARKMNEPFLLDVLHDTLVREGFYKDFIK